jgi:predicted metal-dependent hydrolase
MRAHGYELDGFLRVFERVCGAAERASPAALNLAITAAAEHYTATFAELAFENFDSGIFEARVHPTMMDFLMWHAAEEIEHKSVAFDVLLAVDSRYSVRAAGAVLATAILLGFWVAGTTMLLRQEGTTWAQVRTEMEASYEQGELGRPAHMVRALLEYLRPGFHPSQKDNGWRVAEYFARSKQQAA